MLDPNFWQDKSNSQKIIKEKKLYEDLINSYENSINNLNDLDELNQLAIKEENITIQNEVFTNIKNLREIVKKNEIKCFLSNEADSLRLLYRNSCWCWRNRKPRLGRNVKKNVFKMVR